MLCGRRGATHPPPALPEVGCQMFFSEGYSPVQQPEFRWLQHAPPPQVASITGQASCLEACDLCKHLGCQQCPHCPLHVDRGDKTHTLFM
eukprot:2690422-Lingulodinium_polyedra.AAC.2